MCSRYLSEGGVHVGRVGGRHQVHVEHVLERLAPPGAGLQLVQVDVSARERLERGEQRTRAVEHRHHQGRLVGGAEVGRSRRDRGELREVLLLGLDALREYRQAGGRTCLDARDRGVLAVAALGDQPGCTCRVVHGHRFDAHRGEELLALRERLPMGVRAADLLEARTRHAEQRVIDAHEHLADDLQHARVLQHVVGLVHRAGLGVLERDDPVVGCPARHPREDEPDRLARHRFGHGEERAHRALAVRARFSLVGDLHGREA